LIKGELSVNERESLDLVPRQIGEKQVNGKRAWSKALPALLGHAGGEEGEEGGWGFNKNVIFGEEQSIQNWLIVPGKGSHTAKAERDLHVT